jgi:hypothetical protein
MVDFDVLLRHFAVVDRAIQLMHADKLLQPLSLQSLPLDLDLMHL